MILATRTLHGERRAMSLNIEFQDTHGNPIMEDGRPIVISFSDSEAQILKEICLRETFGKWLEDFISAKLREYVE